jgi:curli biogenesis system outer membrane secretion channel CsgG
MKSRKTGKRFPVVHLKISLIFLCLLILFFDCALIPGVDSYRADEIARGPDFAPYFGLKRRIAILDFENLADFGGQKLGSAVADQLISHVARSNRFVLIERSRIEQVLQEQALGQSGTITEETAAQVGKLLGVECLVLGKIFDARQETQNKKIDNEEKEWSLKLKATVGIVHISYKMVNTTTGEILLADDVSETEIKPGFGLKTKDVDLENMFEFDETVLGIAVRKAVNKIAQDIVDNASVIEWIGKVVQSSADTLIYFTPGRGAGVKLEQLFDIYETVDSEAEELLNEDLNEYNQSKARIKVTGFIGDKVARGKVIQGENIKRGDTVKLAKNIDNNNSK